MTPARRKFITRRGFLVKTGWVAAGLTVTAGLSYPFVRAAMPVMPTLNEPALEDGFAWVQVVPGGTVRFYCPRMEMGQGAPLGLSQVVAEELNVGQQQIECVLPDTDETPPFKMTVGSESISSFFDPVSFGAAHLREALRAVASEKTGLPPGRIKDARGGFLGRDGTRIAYGELVPAGAQVLSLEEVSAPDKTVPRYAVRRKGGYRAIGHGWKHHELEAIVTGRTVYSRDVLVPDMAYGHAVRPPAFGARLQSADTRAAEAMPGVMAVVMDKDIGFLGIVADNPFVLPAAIEALKVNWEVPQGLDQDEIDARLDVDRLRANDDFEHTISEEGDIAAARRSARHRSAARYDTPFASHAIMEPRASVVSVKRNKVEVWCASQDPFFVQRNVAKAIGREIGDVTVRSHRMGGGFGGRVPCQASVEAARLSAAVGRPVRIQWDRAAELQNTYLHPAYSHHIDAGVTREGLISHWEHDFVSSPIVTGQVPSAIAWMLDMTMADFGTKRGGVSPYTMASRRIRFSDIRTALAIGPWRALGAAPNAFAIESMMDELAHKAGIDPLEFRLRNLPGPGHRLAGVLRRVGEISAWGGPAPTGRGRGIACAVYKGETAVAVVAEVRIDHGTEEIQVTKTWCVQDCGLVINPDQVKALIMGNIVWGCGMALKERISIEAGGVEQRNFDTYEILRHRESPDMTIALIDSDAPPVGVGESALAPVAPAIANALFAASGKRIRKLPISYDRVFPEGRS